MLAYGKNEATCWLAGAVFTLQKRVEWLEAAANGDFEIQDTTPKARVPRHKPASDLEHGVMISADDNLQDMENIPVMGMSPIHGDGFEQVLSDDDGLAASTISLATVRSTDLCVSRQKAVNEMDFFDVDPRVYSQDSAGELDSENLTACNRVETVPLRHVSFAETVEMVEFGPVVHAAPAPMVEYDAALMMAHRAHVAPAPTVEYDAAPTMVYRVYATPIPVVEYDAPAQTVVHQVHAAPVPAVEYDAPAPTVAHQVHAAPAPVDEYDASAACATTSPLVDGPIVKVVHVPQVQVVEKTIEILQLQTIEKIVDTPEIQTVQSTESLDTAPDRPIPDASTC